MHGQTTTRPHPAQRDGIESAANSEARSLLSLTLTTKRELQAPLRALRVLLEGRRSNGTTLTEQAFVDRAFIDRALDELLRTERAAANLVQWTCPREIRRVPCTIAEIIESLSSSLDARERERCHFVIEDGSTDVVTDGPLLVEAFTRTIREVLDGKSDPTSEVMIHAHADDDRMTISLVDGPTDGDRSLDVDEVDREPTFAESLLERDIARLDGRVSIHRTSEHRCCVAVLPRHAVTGQSSPLAYGGAA